MNNMREIPDHIFELANQIKNEDNRCTAYPMYCVQILIRDSGYDPNYSSDTIWINMNSGDYEECDEDESGAEEFGYKDRWETVMFSLTEQGCNDYIELNGHNLKRQAHDGQVRIYVESFYRCQEMIVLRNFLLSLVQENKT